MGSFEAEGNEGFGVSVSVPLPCPDSQPDYPLRHAQDSHIYRVCVRLPTTVELFPQAVDDVLPDGERGGDPFSLLRFEKQSVRRAGVRNSRIRSIYQFDESISYSISPLSNDIRFSFHKYTELGLSKTLSGSKIKICERGTSVNDQPSQFYTL